MPAAAEAHSAQQRPGLLMPIGLRYVRIVDATSEFFGAISEYLVIVGITRGPDSPSVV